MKSSRSDSPTVIENSPPSKRLRHMTNIDAVPYNLEDLINSYKQSTQEDAENLFRNHAPQNEDAQTNTPEENQATIDVGQLSPVIIDQPHTSLKNKFELALKTKFNEIIKQTDLENAEQGKEQILDMIVSNHANNPTIYLNSESGYGSAFYLLHHNAYSALCLQETLEKIFNRPNMQIPAYIAKEIANTIRSEKDITFYKENDRLAVQIGNRNNFNNWIHECRNGVIDTNPNDPKIKFEQLIKSNFQFTIEEINNISDQIKKNNKGQEYLQGIDIPQLNKALRLLDETLYTNQHKQSLVNTFKIQNMPDSKFGKVIAREIRRDMGINSTWREKTKNPSIFNYKIFINSDCFKAWLNLHSKKEVPDEDNNHASQTTSITTSTSNHTQAHNDLSSSIAPSHLAFFQSSSSTQLVGNVSSLEPNNSATSNHGSLDNRANKS